MSGDLTARPGLEILDKAGVVLSVLEKRGELSAAALAVAASAPASSTYRLLTSLVGIGLVEHGSRRGLFRLGVDVLRLGSVVEDRLDVREAALPELRRLLAATGATAFLVVRAGSRAVCIERLEGRDVRSLALALGQSLPLHHGAGPRALLAFLPPAEREAVVATLAAEPPGPTPPPPADIEEAVARIRAEGHAVSDGDVTPGIAAVGAPVLNHRGEVVAAVSISGLRSQILGADPDTVPLVREAARVASAALGHAGAAR